MRSAVNGDPLPGGDASDRPPPRRERLSGRKGSGEGVILATGKHEPPALRAELRGDRKRRAVHVDLYATGGREMPEVLDEPVAHVHQRRRAVPYRLLPRLVRRPG